MTISLEKIPKMTAISYKAKIKSHSLNSFFNPAEEDEELTSE